MNIPRARIAFGALACALLAVVSCGGGQVASGGTGGTGAQVASRGPVAQIGSIFVNGVEYDTKGATVTVNRHSFRDTAGTAGGTVLQEGMQVTLHGTINPDGVTGTATDIRYGRTVFGQIRNVTGSGFTVYGQRVVFDRAAWFLPKTGIKTKAAAWLAEDAVVEVSGLVLDDGSVLATYVKELGSMPKEWEYIGQVTDASEGPEYIAVNGGRLEMPSGYDWTHAPIKKGMYVHVHVHVETVPPSTATSIPAEEIQIVDMDLGGDDGEAGEISGVVTELTPGTSFVLAGQLIYISGSTTYKYEPAEHLAVGRHVEVHGEFQSGRLTAREIEFE